jgi:hypothetical protein
MDYKDIRYKFCEISGRYDLTTATQEDNGADFFLNGAQKFLDRLLDTGKAIARYPVILSAGEYVAKSVGIRVVKEVWVSNSDGKTQLTPCSPQELQTNYAEGFASVAQGTPEYYAPALFRPSPDTLSSTTGMYGVDDLILSGTGHYTYNGIIVMPPCDGTYTIEIVGLFYSPVLSATLSGGTWTQTKSYWTEVQFELLIEAALYKLQSLYLNDSAATMHKSSMMEDFLGIDQDAAEEDTVGNLQMGG